MSRPCPRLFERPATVYMQDQGTQPHLRPVPDPASRNAVVGGNWRRRCRGDRCGGGGDQRMECHRSSFISAATSCRWRVRTLASAGCIHTSTIGLRTVKTGRTRACAFSTGTPLPPAKPSHIRAAKATGANMRNRYGIEVNLGVSEVAISRLDAHYIVKWNGTRPTQHGTNWGTRPERRMHVQRFDIVILAVGFGEETANTNFPITKSYWDPDNIDDNQAQGIDAPRVLVSGTGDGGLIDVLRYSFRDFRHEATLHNLRDKWLGPVQFEQVRKTLWQIELELVAKRNRLDHYDAELNHRYRAVADGLELAAPIPLGTMSCRFSLAPRHCRLRWQPPR